MTDELRAWFVDDTPPGWLAMLEAAHVLGVSRQTVLQRVKRGELEAVHVRTGRRKGLRIRVNQPDPGLFDQERDSFPLLGWVLAQTSATTRMLST